MTEDGYDAVDVLDAFIIVEWVRRILLSCSVGLVLSGWLVAYRSTERPLVRALESLAVAMIAPALMAVCNPTDPHLLLAFTLASVVITVIGAGLGALSARIRA